MKEFIKLIWQLPQNIIAFIIIFILNKENERCLNVINNHYVWFVKHGVFKCGVSLGDFIILSEKYKLLNKTDKFLTDTVLHEYGHQRQSIFFGPLYLLIIGLPSLCNNIYSRIFKKDSKWYYNRYPEKWADELGEVHRWDNII